MSIPCTPADALSGVATTNPACPLGISSEGAADTGTVTVTDVAGNTASFTSPVVKIGKTPPAVSVTSVSQGASYTLGNVPAPPAVLPMRCLV